MTNEDRTEKALQSWANNASRHTKIQQFLEDSRAAPTAVSDHVDTKSAYTVRTRLARRYPDLTFKVIRTEDGRGQICVKRPEDERPWPTPPSQGVAQTPPNGG